jgi:hypothetical protein
MNFDMVAVDELTLLSYFRGKQSIRYPVPPGYGIVQEDTKPDTNFDSMSGASPPWFWGPDQDGSGIVPEATKPGDMLCFLYGASMPFILRPLGDNFTIVGECYIVNFMQGEGMNYPGISDESLQPRKFAIV